MTSVDDKESMQGAVWKGRPSIGSYAALYAIVWIVILVVLEALELWASSNLGPASSIFSASLKLGSVKIPSVFEVATAIIVVLLYLGRLVGLLLLRARNSYELRSDGLYLNRGILNLQNVFVSAMAFSDARLIRPLGMRLVGRSLIVVEANDGRKFELRLIKDGLHVQTLIRETLSHPTVRVAQGPQ